MPIIKTTCTRDCPDTCGLDVEVEHGRITAIRGATDHPVTRGFVCYKQHSFTERVYGSRRVSAPLLREGSGWREISWERAIDVFTGRLGAALESSGPLSIFSYQSAGSIGATKSLNRRFFNLLGGGTFASGSLCGGAGIAGQTLDFGVRTAHDPFDLLNSKFIIIWGRNPAETNIHLIPILKEAKSRGAKITLIDPLPTPTAGFADIRIKPEPGTDPFLALAIGAALVEMRLTDLDFTFEHTVGFADYQSMLNKYSIDWLSRRCDVPAIQIEEIAMEYGLRKPAAILLGWGAQRYAWGGETFRLIDALAALTGNLGVPGGGVSHGLNESRLFDDSLKEDGPSRARREVSKARLGTELPLVSNPSLEVGVVTGANPAVQSPDSAAATRALSAIGFLVVIDYEMTETARLADLVLPSTTFLEEDDVVGSFFHRFIGEVNRAIEPVGEAKSDLEIFQAIADKLGVQGLEGTTSEWIERLLSPAGDAGVTRDGLRKRHWVPTTEPGVPFENGVFPTESSRFNFVYEVPQVWGYDGDYPLTLLSIHPREYLHSEMTEAQLKAPFRVVISPAAAQVAGLVQNDPVLVSSRSGSFTALTSINPGMRDDTIACAQGRPLPDGPNAATTQAVSNIGENSCYYQVRVKLSKP